MNEIIATAIFGAILCVIGVINMTGNISTLHRHHRHRDEEEDKKPMGKLVGIGTLVIGLSMIVFGALTYLNEKVGSVALQWFSYGELITGLVVGIVLNCYAIIKYNKGLF